MAEQEEALKPTKERLRKSGGDFARGDNRGGTGQYTMRDSPIEKALHKRQITPKQYAAATKFYGHWYRAGLAEHMSSIDPNRVFAPDHGSYGHMPTSENAAFHRDRYRKAVRALGLKGSFVIEWVVCRESPIVEVGTKLGWDNVPQARAAAVETLRSGLDVLADLWGINDV